MESNRMSKASARNRQVGKPTVDDDVTLLRSVIGKGAILTAAIILLSSATTPVNAGFIYTDIADISGTSSSLNTAGVNDSGTVVFRTITGSGRTIYTGNGGALTTVAQTGATTLSLGFPAIANNGTVQYSTIDNSGDRRLVQSSGGVETTVFGINSDPNFASVIPGNWISDNGAHTAFKAGLTGGGTGVFSGDGTPGGPFTAIATPANGFSTQGNQVSVNNSGVVAFQAGSQVGGSIHKGDGSGPLTTIVDSSTTVSSGETMAYVDSQPTINNNGDVGFVGLFDGFADGGYFIGDGGALTTVLKFSELSKTVASVKSPDLNDLGVMAFLMGFTDGSEGIYLGPDLVGDKVIETGDELFGSIVTDVDFFRGLNNNNQIAFGVELADGSQHIVRADAVFEAAIPAPSAAFLLFTALGVLFAVRRKG